MIKTVNDNVLIIPDKKPEKVGGIYVPETSKKQPETGVVHADYEDLKKGTAVVFKKYGATTVKIGKDEYLIVPREDILAIIEE